MSDTRLLELQKQREAARSAIEQQKALLSQQSQKDRSVNRFVGRTEGIQETLKSETVGLVRLEEFQEKKRKLEEQIEREAARTAELQ